MERSKNVVQTVLVLQRKHRPKSPGRNEKRGQISDEVTWGLEKKLKQCSVQLYRTELPTSFLYGNKGSASNQSNVNVNKRTLNKSQKVSVTNQEQRYSKKQKDDPETIFCTFCSCRILPHRVKDHVVENHLHKFYSSSKMTSVECTLCKLCFLLESDLKDHVMDEHNSDFCEEVEINSFTCKLCSLNIKTQNEMGKHIQRKHKDKLKAGRHKYEEHFAPSKFAMVKCVICKLQFLSEDELLDHIDSEHWNKFSKDITVSIFCCKICDLNIKTQREIEAHIARKHLDQLLRQYVYQVIIFIIEKAK